MTSHCPSCESYMPYREATVFDEHGPYCGSCEDQAMENFCDLFVDEVLFEDDVQRSAFFPRNYRFADQSILLAAE